MADGRATSSTATQTCQVLPTSIKALRLSATKSNRSREELFRQPTFDITGKGIVLAKAQALANGSTLSSGKASFGSNSRHLVLDLSNHDLGQENELVTMLESPREKREATSNHAPSPNRSPRDVTYGSAPPNVKGDAKPSRHDAALYPARETSDNTSEIDVDIQARQMRARERIEISKRRVFRTRLAVKGRRDRIRILREKARDAGESLVRKMDELMALNNMKDLKDIGPYYQRLRDAQDELGPAEAAYDLLEARLEDEEQDLDDEEIHFYRHFDISVSSVPDSKLDDMISPIVKPYSPPETEVQNLNLESDLVREYLEKVAEAENLKEELDDLEYDYYQSLNEASFRKRHTIALSAEAATFLRNFEILHADTLETLHTVEYDLLDLRKQCLKRSLFAESEHVYERRDAFKEDVMESVYEARDRSPLRVAASHIDYPEDDIYFEDKREYVNKWLLEWVQDSSIEIMMLKSWIYFKYPDNGKDLGEEKWSELALENWDNDSAGEFTNERYNASRMDTIAGEIETGRLWGTTTRQTGFSMSLPSLEVDLDDVEVEEVIMGSETGSYATQKLDTEPVPRRSSSF